MHKVLDWSVYVFLFVVGWISGGGILAYLSMWLIESLFDVEGYNTSFLGGCLWGTFGVLAGVFMVSTAKGNFAVDKRT